MKKKYFLLAISIIAIHPMLISQPVINITKIDKGLANPSHPSNANLGFEAGINTWTATGNAFANQPVQGNIMSERVLSQMQYNSGGIGGDYWKGMQYETGVKGNWIGTYEKGNGDAATGTLTSRPFIAIQRNLSFLLGGGKDAFKLYVELQVKTSDFEAAWGATRRPGYGYTEDGYARVSRINSSLNSEEMYRYYFDLDEILNHQFTNKLMRIQIVDNSSAGWGHINVDDFTFAPDLNNYLKINRGGFPMLVDKNKPVWGYADTHTHPMNNLAFGGGLIQGKSFPESGETSDRALAGNGLVSLLMNKQGFDKGFMQQMYIDWIKRAYDGGLRLISMLAVNNWLLSGNSIKKQIAGSSQPEDDKGSGDLQIKKLIENLSQPEYSSWIEIAKTPEDARRIIASNKLAVVLGVEIDLMGNFSSIPNISNSKIPIPIELFKPMIAPLVPLFAGHILALPPVVTSGPDVDNSRLAPVVNFSEDQLRSSIKTELERLHSNGVRQITVFHYVSGLFGGTAIFNRLFNEMNRVFTNNNYVVEDGSKYGIKYKIQNDSWGTVDETIRSLVTGQIGASNDQSWENTHGGHINKMGLNVGGKIMLQNAAKLGLLVDIDHAGYKCTDEILEYAKSLGNYPLLSSHSDFGDLGLTGNGEFTHNALSNNDQENYQNFKTTLHGNLRHEGMGPRNKYEGISRSGGICAPLILGQRRLPYKEGSIVSNDCDGTSKTFCQMYMYASEVMNYKGVAISTDNTFVTFCGPRFGPNSAFKLGEETIDHLRKTVRLGQVRSQKDGVKYDKPIVAWNFERFSPSGESAYSGTGKAWEYEDAFRAVAAIKCNRNPWALGSEAKIPSSGEPTKSGRILNYVKGYFATSLSQLTTPAALEWGTGDEPYEQRAAYCVKNNITPEQLRSTEPEVLVGDRINFLINHYNIFKEVWDTWQIFDKDGKNEPLRRLIFGGRDYDINIDGMVHYGMYPDFLQDCKNVGLPVKNFEVLFNSAEDYIQMWEKAERLKPTIR
jgi:hypothetical protein